MNVQIDIAAIAHRDWRQVASPNKCHSVNQNPHDPLLSANLNPDEVGRLGTENAATTVGAPVLGGLPKIVRFDALARCGDEIWIENDGQIYRLRKTRQGKLILTK